MAGDAILCHSGPRSNRGLKNLVFGDKEAQKLKYAGICVETMGARALVKGKRGLTTEQLIILVICVIVFIALLFIVKDKLAKILVIES